MTSLANRVKTRREALKLKQGEVAKIAGLKQPDVSKIELGRILETTKVVGLAKALRCRPEWLLTGRGPIDPIAEHPQPLYVGENVAAYPPPPAYDQWTLAAIGIMQNLKEYQREGALAALKTYIGNLSPPSDGQALSMAG